MDNFNKVSNFSQSKFQSFSLSVIDPQDTNRIALIGRALSAPIRIEILRLLNVKPMLVSEIADALDIQISSAAFHVRTLEEADLISFDYSTKRKGTLKWYTYGISKRLIINLREKDGEGVQAKTPYIQNINIGDYVDAEMTQDCGIATEREHIMENQPNRAFIPERHDAQIIWSKFHGSLTYAIPNDYAESGKLSEVSFSLELCSEARGYNDAYPSDITFWVNGVELCTWTCPGDYGDRYGKYTPPWWFPESTKYGLLTLVSIRDKGVYLNEKLINRHVTLKDLKLSNGNRTTFQFGVKKDAEHLGGFNVFGNKFGDYNQDIIFTAMYQNI